jgi:hypothetical protein
MPGFGFFAQSAQSFFRRIIVGKVSLIRPVPDAHVLTTVLIVAVAAAVLAAVLARRSPNLAVGATAGTVAVIGLAGGVYSMNQFMNQAGFPNLSFEQQSWVDQAVGTDADVRLAPQGLDYFAGELVSFNRSLARPGRDARATLSVDPATGELRGAPRYLVTQDGVVPAIGVGGPQVAESTYLPVQVRLIRVAPRALWEFTSPRSLRVFGTDCVTATIAQPPGTTAKQRFTFGSAHGVLAGSPVTVTSKAAPEVTLRGGGAATIVSLSRGPCP